MISCLATQFCIVQTLFTGWLQRSTSRYQHCIWEDQPQPGLCSANLPRKLQQVHIIKSKHAFPGITQETDPSGHFSVDDPSPSRGSDLQSREEEWEFWLLLLFWGVDKLFFGFIQNRNTLNMHITDLAWCVATSSALLQLLHITPQCA